MGQSDLVREGVSGGGEKRDRLKTASNYYQVSTIGGGRTHREVFRDQKHPAAAGCGCGHCC